MVIVNILLHLILSMFMLYIAVIALNDRRKSTVNFGLVTLSLFYNELKILVNNTVDYYPFLSIFSGVFVWAYNSCIILSLVSILSSGLISNLLRWGGENAVYAQLKLRSTLLQILTDKYSLEKGIANSILNDIENIKNHA